MRGHRLKSVTALTILASAMLTNLASLYVLFFVV